MIKYFKYFLAVGLMVMCLPLTGQIHDSFFRGSTAPSYKYFHNGNPYWNDRAFTDDCSVFFNGKEYNDLVLNVDANYQELLLRRFGDVVPMVLDRDMITWFTMNDSLFVNLNNVGITDAPVGFYKVLSDKGDVLMTQTRKQLSSSSSDANGAPIGYYDKSYNTRVTSFFMRVISFWLYKDNTLYKISSKKDILKLYPQHKKSLKKAIRQVGRSGDSRSKYLENQLLAAMDVVNGSVDPVSVIPYTPFHLERNPEENLPEVFNTNKVVLQSSLISSLPSGWFSDSSDDDSSDGIVKYVNGTVTKAIHSNKTYELGDKTVKRTGKVNVSGYVYSLGEGAPVVQATVYDEVSGTYVTTDNDGFYSINLPLGENVIHFSEYSMEDFNAKVIVYDNASMEVQMKERSEMLQSALIAANSRANHRTAKMGIERMSATSLSKMPSAFGEGDVLKAVQTFPGVKSVGEAAGGINVRGGSTDQNLILFNGSTIYNPNHMFGLFSAFDPDVVEEMELYKSSIPSEYGGRISSVLSVKSKPGDSQKIKAAAGIGVLTSHAYIEGPLVKDKTTFVLGGRTTYSNWILGKLPKDSGYSGGKANFSDVSLGVTHRISSDNTVQMNAYWSTDGFSFSGDTTFRYRNLNIALKWKKKLTAKTSMETSAGYDWYTASVDDNFNPFDAYRFSSVIRQALAKSQISTALGNHTLYYGAQLTPYALDRGAIIPVGEESNHESRSLGTEYAFEPSVWVSDSWQMTDKLELDYGTRLSSFLHVGPSKFYANPDIRLSGKYSFTPDFSLKAGFNTMSQYIHMVSNTTNVSPMDTWKLSDDKLKPQTGWQAAAGAYLSVAKSLVDLSVEMYYKNTYNYLDYKTGAELVMNENLADELITTKGKAYGVEFMVRKPAGKLNGWISYTYSRSLLKEMEDRGVMTINKGAWYPAAHDKPHDLKIVANYALTHRYSISANVDYSTGRPVTVPVGIYYYNGGYRLAYSDRNGHRIPDYFRFDLALNIEPGHYLKKFTHFSYTLGVYNLTGRKNAYSVFYTTHDGTKITGHMLSVFATQIPYININVKF